YDFRFNTVVSTERDRLPFEQARGPHLLPSSASPGSAALLSGTPGGTSARSSASASLAAGTVTTAPSTGVTPSPTSSPPFSSSLSNYDALEFVENWRQLPRMDFKARQDSSSGYSFNISVTEAERRAGLLVTLKQHRDWAYGTSYHDWQLEWNRALHRAVMETQGKGDLPSGLVEQPSLYYRRAYWHLLYPKYAAPAPKDDKPGPPTQFLSPRTGVSPSASPSASTPPSGSS
ncbi:unnamed protein product, partial [Amoebophrya sp. A25]